MRRHLLGAAVACALVAGGTPTPVQAAEPPVLGPVKRVSGWAGGIATRSCDFRHGLCTSDRATTSESGRLVAFASDAPLTSDLPADNTYDRVYVRNVVTNGLRRVDVPASGTAKPGVSRYPRISGHGNAVVFESSIPNLVPDDPNGPGLDWFEVSLDSGAIRRLPLSIEDHRRSEVTDVGASGGTFAYSRTGSHDVEDVYWLDAATGRKILVSTRKPGTPSGADVGGAWGASMAGGDVAFSSWSPWIEAAPPEATDEQPRIYIRRAVGTSEDRLEYVGLGAGPILAGEGARRHMAYSRDGGVFVEDVTAGAAAPAERVDIGPDGSPLPADRLVYPTGLSRDGRTVALTSLAEPRRSWVRNLDTRQTVAVAETPVSLGDDGRTVVFSSHEQLTGDDHNGEADIYRRTVDFHPGGAAERRITEPGGLCVAVAGGRTANGTPVELAACADTDAQRWRPAAGPVLKALGKCLDVSSGSIADGARVQLWDCNGTRAQQWQATEHGELVNPASGRCLDAVDRRRVPGARLQIWTCWGGENQHWRAPRPRGGVTGIGGRCLDVTDGSTADGTPVQLWDCTGAAWQRWTVTGDGSLRTLGRCLGVAGGRTANGTPVQLLPCDGGASQSWYAASGDTLVNRGSGRCLDTVDRRFANGTRLQVWDCHGDENQRWQVPPGRPRVEFPVSFSTSFAGFEGTLVAEAFASREGSLRALGQLYGTTNGRHGTGLVSERVDAAVLEIRATSEDLRLAIGPLDARGREPSTGTVGDAPRAERVDVSLKALDAGDRVQFRDVEAALGRGAPAQELAALLNRAIGGY